jgi:hypothetical protein
VISVGGRTVVLAAAPPDQLARFVPLADAALATVQFLP